MKKFIAVIMLFAFTVSACSSYEKNIQKAQKTVYPQAMELHDAMAEEDEYAIYTIAKEIEISLGEYAGVPESQPEYYIPKLDGSTVSYQNAQDFYYSFFYMLTAHNYLGDGVFTQGNYPEGVNPLPRATGYQISGFCEAYSNAQAPYMSGVIDIDLSDKIIQCSNYLLSIQLENGMFPFPDFRGTSSQFAKGFEKFYEEEPDAFQNGWVTADDGGGGTQFDTAVCAVALIDAYKFTQDEKYLLAAKKAADYLAAIPLSINWNYNSFSVWMLSEYYAVSGDTTYLDVAVKKCKLGVLPGQMTNGRWADPHNAKQCYHIIILRSLISLYTALDDNHQFKAELYSCLSSSVDNLCDEITANGVTSTEAVSQLILAKAIFPDNDKIGESINILIGAVFEKSGFYTDNFSPDGNEALLMARIMEYLKNMIK